MKKTQTETFSGLSLSDIAHELYELDYNNHLLNQIEEREIR